MTLDETNALGDSRGFRQTTKGFNDNAHRSVGIKSKSEEDIELMARLREEAQTPVGTARLREEESKQDLAELYKTQATSAQRALEETQGQLKKLKREYESLTKLFERVHARMVAFELIYQQEYGDVPSDEVLADDIEAITFPESPKELRDRMLERLKAPAQSV